MPPSAQIASESLVPVVRYRDVGAAANWLVTAFGFELKSLVHASDGAAIYAEMFHGRSTIMLVPVGQSDLDAHMRQPDELGGIETQTCYLTVTEARAHLDRAILAGAQIVLPLSGDQGSQQGYSCRDPEGHLWNFGTYAPASSDVAVAVAEPATGPKSQASPAPRRRRVVMPALTLSLAGLAAYAWIMPDNPIFGPISGPITAAVTRLMQSAARPPQTANGASAEALPRDQTEWQAQTQRSHETIVKLRNEVSDARAAVIAAQEAATAAGRDLSAEHARRTEAELGASDAAARVLKLDEELATSKANLAHLESELLKERSARGQSVQAAEAARIELQQEAKRRQQLEQIVEELDRKADERMPVSMEGKGNSTPPDQSTTPQAGLNSTAPADRPAMSETPSETGSVSPPEPAKKQNDIDGTKTDNRAAPVRRIPVERSKPVTTKKAKPPATANAASAKSAAPRKKDDKAWPYNAW